MTTLSLMFLSPMTRGGMRWFLRRVGLCRLVSLLGELCLHQIFLPLLAYQLCLSSEVLYPFDNVLMILGGRVRLDDGGYGDVQLAVLRQTILTLRSFRLIFEAFRVFSSFRASAVGSVYWVRFLPTHFLILSLSLHHSSSVSTTLLSSSI